MRERREQRWCGWCEEMLKWEEGGRVCRQRDGMVWCEDGSREQMRLTVFGAVGGTERFGKARVIRQSSACDG